MPYTARAAALCRRATLDADLGQVPLRTFSPGPNHKLQPSPPPIDSSPDPEPYL